MALADVYTDTLFMFMGQQCKEPLMVEASVLYVACHALIAFTMCEAFMM
jgi:hypothetical protein